MRKNKSAGPTLLRVDSLTDEPLCPCLLLLDTSASMSGVAIAELNAGVSAFKDELTAGTASTNRVEVSVVTFGPVQVRTAFQSVSDFVPARLHASGDAPMGAAIRQGLELLSQHKEEYRQRCLAYVRPAVFLITKGFPTDNWHSAATLIREADYKDHVSFYAVAVSDANMEVLRQVSGREPVKLDGIKFLDFISDSGSTSDER
ncbi:vWA domain-containing protein [Paraburkholderia sp. UCT2]|uniref:vWA domain-containing protein n=1 Tax=Paraburkholderia sp. UCT2 TaxID=2615208 RepID=UPI001655661F|nr:VWA domain-containing protein [Paraburkholderia sp. UCT2]MBC8732615.1 VWA domain-containing protein [Paraburkholderia sp. UCT2]